MASSKVTATMKPKNSDLTSSSSATNRTRRASTSSSSSGLASASLNTHSDHFQTFDRNLTASSLASTMTVDGILRDVYSTPSAESTLLDAQITLLDTPAPLLPTTPSPPPPAVGTMFETTNIINNSSNQEINSVVPQTQANKTVDDVWREIVSGKKEMKEEPDEMMTLEDFLAKAGASEEVGVGVGQDDDIKMPSGGVYSYDHPVTPSAFQMLDKIEGSIVGFGNGVDVASSGRGHGAGRGKRGRAAAVMEPLDKAAQQRQRRMIKNRESAARSRERKQAYQVELESLAVRLEEENERLLKEKEERTKERFKQLMEKLVPVVEQRRPRRKIGRVNSLEW